jgi:Zn2+/Cd2+-exporting ATPase
MQAADVVLLSDAIERLPWLIGVARRSRRVMGQNLVFAIGVIGVLVVCSMAGVVGLPLGVVGHEGSTLLVVGNGLRMLMSGQLPVVSGQRGNRK